MDAAELIDKIDNARVDVLVAADVLYHPTDHVDRIQYEQPFTDLIAWVKKETGT